MKKPYLSLYVRWFYLISFVLVVQFGQAQQFYQYFDGADTNTNNSLIIEIDADSSNVWQIGPPQKTIFDNASTLPNAIVTDTVNSYPPNNFSRFQFEFENQGFANIVAIRWMQKLDLEANADGGIIEMSVNNGATWSSAFDNPNVYNLYGYDSSNVDTLQNGTIAFTGTDSTWKDIWLCYDANWWNSITSVVKFRFTLISDSTESSQDGWMIDNLVVSPTITHTINEKETDAYMHIYPTQTDGRVFIETKKLQQYHIIENIEVLNSSGQVVKSYGISPIKYFLNLNDLADGVYIIKVKTNVKTVTERIVLQRN